MMSAYGTKRTSRLDCSMSAIGGKADMALLHCKCLLLTQSELQTKYIATLAWSSFVGLCWSLRFGLRIATQVA